MISKKWQCLSLVFVFALVGSSVSVGQDLVGIKCIVNGKKPATAESSAEYKGSKVYFCCEDCLAKFQEATGKAENPYAIKANHQLVLTGQYVQTGCPQSGGEIDEKFTARIGGTTIGFCCQHCQEEVEAAEGLAAKAELVFSDGPFAKAYDLKKPDVNLEGVKCMLMPQKAVNEKFSIDHAGHKVFFCCNGCKNKYSKDPESFLAKVNYQLVATGQVIQLACPFSGEEVSDEFSSEVGGVVVKYCCEHCKSKVTDAEPAEQLEMVFGAKGFQKGFTDSQD